MALLEDMPPVTVDQSELRQWGLKWQVHEALSKKEGMDFGVVFDKQVGNVLAKMLGGIEIVTPGLQDLMPKKGDVVEVGAVRIIGGIRPQNYDVGYRPDGARFVFDSKTLNDTDSVRKNFQNMVNDLGTESTTVHTRFPYAVVGFMVVIPSPCFTGETRRRFTRMLDRLLGRDSPIDLTHKAEALSLVLWNPADGTIDTDWPPEDSLLRIEKFSAQVQAQYHERYDGMPPHHKPSKEQKTRLSEAGEPLADVDESQDDRPGSTD